MIQILGSCGVVWLTHSTDTRKIPGSNPGRTILMIFKQIPSGYDNNFSYLIADEKTKEAALIDPSVELTQIKEEIKGFKVVYIINTHTHHDHTAGNEEIQNLTKAKIIQHENSKEKHDISVKDNQIIKIGDIKLKFIFTPGHIKDHICILVENKLITGDLLFVQTIGGTGPRFKGSDNNEMFQSLQKIKKLVLLL